MSTAVTEVRVRPEAIRPLCFAVSVFLLAALGTTAIVLPSTTDGVKFSVWDQIGIAGIGVLLAIAFWQPTRPRVVADAKGVRARGPIGDFRFIPWDVVEAVEFRPKWRWARLILAGDETISLYAVQRWDRERAVHTMRQLRALHAAAVDQR